MLQLVGKTEPNVYLIVLKIRLRLFRFFRMILKSSSPKLAYRIFEFRNNLLIINNNDKIICVYKLFGIYMLNMCLTSFFEFFNEL